MTYPLTSSPLQQKTSSLSTPNLNSEPRLDSATVANSSPATIHNLAALWARKYVNSVTTRDEADKLRQTQSLAELTSKQGREATARKLTQQLRFASAQAWSKTETLLSHEIKRHGINTDLINPWGIAEDAHNLFKKSLDAYAERVTPRRLSIIVGGDLGKIRRKYTAVDPRIIGFVGMQFHYTGVMLLEYLSSVEQALFSPFLKVIDDHLYIPLRDAYEAAANYGIGSPVLQAVQHLLPVSTKIAHAVCNQVCRLNPGYESHSGLLTTTPVKISSVRDVEMFQVYLCLCALEGSIRSLQQELFPLCVMLYPRLNVKWALVQDMLQTLGWEMHDRLHAEDVAIFLPYLKAFTEMFAIDVFQDL